MDETHDFRARQRITDLVHTYALAIRRGQPDRCTTLFTDDASFEVRYADPTGPGIFLVASRSEGRDEVIASIAASALRVRMFPMIHNLLVEVDCDIASGSSLMIGRAWPSGEEIMGEYADTFRCEGGTWKFSSRVFTHYSRS